MTNGVVFEHSGVEKLRPILHGIVTKYNKQLGCHLENQEIVTSDDLASFQVFVNIHLLIRPQFTDI